MLGTANRSNQWIEKGPTNSSISPLEQRWTRLATLISRGGVILVLIWSAFNKEVRLGVRDRQKNMVAKNAIHRQDLFIVFRAARLVSAIACGRQAMLKILNHVIERH